MNEEVLPQWMESNLVTEPNFAEAYESLSAKQKSWIKKNIAFLFSWYGYISKDEQRCLSIWRQGFQSLKLSYPKEWAFLYVDKNAVSPSQCVAALFPPLTAGVKKVFALGLKENEMWTKSLLSAFELAGLEDVYQGDFNTLNMFLDFLARGKKEGIIIFLGNNAPSEYWFKYFGDNPHIKLQTLICPRRGGIWVEDPQTWDFEALKFSQPRLDLTVWSEESLKLLSSWNITSGAWEDFLRQEYDVLYVPKNKIESAIGNASFVFGPDQECNWIWPEFTHQQCITTKVALTSNS